jgi:hypothetical protein
MRFAAHAMRRPACRVRRLIGWDLLSNGQLHHRPRLARNGRLRELLHRHHFVLRAHQSNGSF